MNERQRKNIEWEWRKHKAQNKLVWNSTVQGTYRRPETEAQLTADIKERQRRFDEKHGLIGKTNGSTIE